MLRVTLAESVERILEPFKIRGKETPPQVRRDFLLQAMHSQLQLFKGEIDEGLLSEIAFRRDLSLEQVAHWARVVDIFLKECLSFLPLDSLTLEKMLEVGLHASTKTPENYLRTIREGLQRLLEKQQVVEEKKLKSRTTHPLTLVVAETVAAVERQAAEMFRVQLEKKPDSVLGLATGSTSLGLYSLLASMQREGQIDFSRVLMFFNLDEYVGMQGDFLAETYAHYMDANFYDRLGLKVQRGKKRLLPYYTEEPAAACRNFEAWIVACRGIDLQLMGLGPDIAHFAFCEPGTPMTLPTHVVSLNPRTRIANSRNFMSDLDRNILGLQKDQDPFPRVKKWDGEPEKYAQQIAYFWNVVMSRVPTHAMTVGPATILKQSRKILMLATGKGKAEAVYKTVASDPTIMVPASLLKLHPGFVLMVDLAAAAGLAAPWNQVGIHKIGGQK